MKLSTAIRIGAKMHEQGTGTLYDEDNHTCALGAALFGAGATVEDVDRFRCNDAPFDEFLDKHFGLSLSTQISYPASIFTADPTGQLFWVIARLNDTHSWTYEEIADYLEGIGL